MGYARPGKFLPLKILNDELLSISESSDDESLSLSLSDSTDDELYFLFLDPLFSFLEESCFLFFRTSLFSPRHCYDTCYLKFYQVTVFLMEPSQLE